MLRKTIQQLLYKGGLKLKLISFVFISIFLAISIQNYFIIPFIKKSIEQKAFEISTVTIEQISNFSYLALLERSYENRVSLNEAILKLQHSQLEGLLGLAIYQRQKEKEREKFTYLAGFGTIVTQLSLDKELLNKLKNSTREKVSYDTYIIKAGTKKIETYRFIRPVFYHYKNKDILLGFSLLYYDKNAINSVVDKVLNYIYSVAFIILLIATLYAYFIGSRVTKPLLKITKASEEITKGNLDISLHIHTNDEIENLANHFNTMTQWLKEKNKLQKFVSDSTIDMIKSSTHTNISLGGQYKEMTFLFCDIRNFTSLCEQHTPQEVIEVINSYFTLQANIIKQYNGDIDKFIGDEIMASFSGKNAIQNALKCAVAIQKAIDDLNKLRKEQSLTFCYVGIGISSGKVIIGNVGYNKHMDYTAIGLSVNLTNRLCAIAKEKEILIDEDSFLQSKTNFIFNATRSLDLKGISKNIVAYCIDYKKN